MRKYFIRAIVGAWILGVASGAANAAPGASAELLRSLPPPARRTVQSEVGHERLDSVTRTNGSEGEIIYEVQTVKAGKTRDLTVAADGKLLDLQVFIDETPDPVRQSIQSLTRGGKLGDITKNIGDAGEDTFEVELTRDAATRTFTVDAGGRLLEMQVFLPETPPSVQQTIQSKVAGAKLGDITKTIADDEVTYDVEMTRAGRSRRFSVSTNGELLEEQVFLEEAPETVRKAIQLQASRSRLGEINKSTDAGEVVYEAKLTIGRRLHSVTFDGAGALKLEEEDMAWADLPAPVKLAVKPLQGAGEVTDITRTTEGAQITYEIKLRDERGHRTLTFNPDGKPVAP